MRLAVSHNDEAARISVSDLDVKFLDLPEGENPTRVRRLGSFTIEIGQRGTEKVLKRSVNVMSEGEAPKETQTAKATELAAILQAIRGRADPVAKDGPEEARQSTPEMQEQPRL
jgi:hypothetical protein